MRKHFKYLSYVLRHKWYVFLECCKMGIPWRGLLHDLSKFSPDEWFPYVEFFYGDHSKPRRDATGYYKPYNTGDDAFDFAWLLHQKRNRHHWQWWILPLDDGGVKVIEMSDADRREMLADWRGAGKALGTPNSKAWYEAHKHLMNLHAGTRKWIESQLGMVASEWD